MKTNINRRSFLRATAGASLLLPAGLLAQQTAAEKSAPKFEVRPLGKTGIRLPILSMGVMKADNPNLVKAALRNGIVHLDTAHVYQKGNNELMLGKVLKNVPRDSYVISTKIKPDGDPKSFLARFETSLQRLQLEYVDLFYVHALSSAAEVLDPQILDLVAKLKKEGRIKHAGVSTHKNESEVIDAAIKSNFYELVLTAYNFKKPAALKAAVARAAAAGLGIVAMKTMAGAKNINIPAALKWALQDKNVSTAIPGFTDFDQLDVCLNTAANLAYTPDEKTFIAQSATLDTLYCQQCDQCSGQCPQNLPIPDLMRAYMYAHGYRHPGLAKETLADYNIPDNPCANCTTCTVQCASNFDIAAKVKDITRIQQVPDEFLV